MSVRLKFYTMKGFIVNYSEELEEYAEINNLDLVFVDPMSSSKCIIGEIMFECSEFGECLDNKELVKLKSVKDSKLIELKVHRLKSNNTFGLYSFLQAG